MGGVRAGGAIETVTLNPVAMAKRIANNPDKEKYEAFKAKADANLADINARLMAAEDIRQQMSEAKRREILG